MSVPFPSSIHRRLAIVNGDGCSQVYFGGADGAPDIIATMANGPADAAGDLPEAQWFVRVTYPGLLPPVATAIEIATRSGLRVQAIADGQAGRSHWLLTGHHSRNVVDAAASRLRKAHRVEAEAFRRISR